MDIVRDWSRLLFQQFTPSRAQTVYGAAMTARNYLLAAFDELTRTSPSLTTIALLLIVLLISLKLLNMLVQAVMFWVRMAVRILFVSAIFFVGCWIWARGPEGVIEDATGVVQYWKGEFREQKDKLQYAQKFYDQVGRGAAGGRAGREGQWNGRGRGW